MHRIKNTKKNRLLHLGLVLVMVLPSTMIINVTEVQAGGGPIPLIGLFAGMIKRNKVYTTANSFIKEKEQYYDSLRAKAAEQLLERELTFGLRDNQVAAYMKVVALIEQERQSMYDFAESEKKAARNQFMDAIQDEITGRMLASTPATALLGAMSKGINSSRGFLDAALNKLSGGGGGFLEDVAKVKKIAERMTIVGELIGGDFGRTIRSLGTNVVDLLDKPTAEITAGLIDVQNQLGDLGDMVSGAQEQGYTPRVSETTKEVVISLVTGERGDPAIAAIADMLVAKHGGGGDFRDRAQDILLGNIAARCAARQEQIKRIIFRLQMDNPEAEAEEEQETPLVQSCQTIDITALVEKAADINQAAQPPAAESTAGENSESAAAEYVWVLVDTAVNPYDEKSAFFGGGQDPDYFGEARFEGKSRVYGFSSTNFSVYDRDVDHEYVFRDATVSVNFDEPPNRLESGQMVNLTASASHSGQVNEGGTGIGLIFQYNLGEAVLDPILSYSPWDATSTGASSGSWSFTAPQASTGAEFILYAGLWNAAPCQVIWTFQAEKSD